MAAYRRVYDSRQLRADCQETGSTAESYNRQSSMGYTFIFSIQHNAAIPPAAGARIVSGTEEGMTMGHRVTGHGSSGSTNLSGSRGSRVSTRDQLTHDFVFFRHCTELRHSLSHNVSLIQLFLLSILWQ